MSISEIMADPKVQAYYLAIEPTASPVRMADKYLQEKLAGNVPGCVAIEHHIRDLARSHFNRSDVLTALKDMERHKSMRKPGKSGGRMLCEIGREIRALYAAGNYERTPGAPNQPDRVKFTIGRLRVTCKDLAGSVELLACKYERGLPAGFGNGRASR